MGFTLTYGTKIAELNEHSEYIGGAYYAAANVKLNEGFRNLPVKYQAKLERLIHLTALTKRKFDEMVWEDFTSGWWESFREEAKKQQLGRVIPAGRCSGWLLLRDYSILHLQAMANTVNTPCICCHKWFSEHVGAAHQCLFGPTRFESEDDVCIEDIVSYTAELDRVVAFLKSCEEQVERFAYKDLIYQQKFRIDDLYETIATHRVLHGKEAQGAEGAK